MQCNQHYLGLWFKLSLPLVLLGFFRSQRQELLSTPNGQAATAARKGERRALGSTLVLVFSPDRQQNLATKKGILAGNLLFMLKSQSD